MNPMQTEVSEGVQEVSSAETVFPVSADLVSPLQRGLEIAVAVIALILTSPIMLVLAILIRRGTSGRALFFQDRVGREGKLFKFVKFRTLYADARARFPELYAYQYDPEQLKA